MKRSRSKSRSRKRMPRNKFKVMSYKEEKGTDYSKYVGWLASEKHDGWHVLFDDNKMVSKSQKRRFLPPYSLHKLRIPLAGELLIAGRQSASVSSLLNQNSKLWKKSRVYVFDALVPGTFTQRSKRAKRQVTSFCKATTNCPVRFATQTKIKSHSHAKKLLNNVTRRGGEGLVLTHPDSLYEKKRSNLRVKIKPRQDAEGVVLARKLRSDGSLKSLKIAPYGRFRFKPFYLGTGFTVKQRKSHRKLFPARTVVTFSYRELTIGRKPKEARFLKIRIRE